MKKESESRAENPPMTPTRLFWHRAKLLGLIAVFLSPFIGGWLALYVFELRPDSGNYGTLVRPVVNLDWPALDAIDGKRHEGGFGRKWTMLLFTSGACAEQCRSNLFYMRQIRILLGRDSGRLQNVLISGAPLDQSMAEFLKEFPQLIVVAGEGRESLLRQFRIDGMAPGATPKLYLVDPDQNLMMHYPPSFDEKRLLEDIRKLIKLSQIG